MSAIAGLGGNQPTITTIPAKTEWTGEKIIADIIDELKNKNSVTLLNDRQGGVFVTGASGTQHTISDAYIKSIEDAVEKEGLNFNLFIDQQYNHIYNIIETNRYTFYITSPSIPLEQKKV